MSSGAPDALHNMQGIRMRAAHAVEPGLVIQSNRVHYERVAFPFSDGVAQEGGVGPLGKRPSVHINLAPAMIFFVENENLVRGLNNLDRPFGKVSARHSNRIAKLMWV